MSLIVDNSKLIFAFYAVIIFVFFFYKIVGKINIDLNVGDKKELVRKPSETLNTKECILESEVDY